MSGVGIERRAALVVEDNESRTSIRTSDRSA